MPGSALGYTSLTNMAETNLEWASIPSAQLNINASLQSGQCFRWRPVSSSQWLGVIDASVVRLIPQAHGFWWQTYPEPANWSIVSQYFALDVDLDPLYKNWIEADFRIREATEKFSGLRILRQDVEEVFFSFLCASCNTISKIKRSIHALEKRAGEPIAEIDGNLFYRFPTAEAIAGLDERDLRLDLWGYRAPRLLQIAREVSVRGQDWLQSLRSLRYENAHGVLTEFFGIGAKIADCICVFGLGHYEAVPVDTHIRRRTMELYNPRLSGKSLTPKTYAALADLLRSRFGSHAGWAQQYLFIDDLRISAGSQFSTAA
jgi:N-glycosylase/DNA lyase